MMKVSAVPGLDRNVRATSRPEGPSSRNTSMMAMSGACAATASCASGSDPAASTRNPISRSSAASSVRVKSESSTSRMRDGEGAGPATRSTLAANPGRSQGADVNLAGIALHPVADADLRHEPEPAAVRVRAEDRADARVEPDEQPRIDEVVEPDPELRADHDLRAGREEERERHVESEGQAEIGVDGDSDRGAHREGEAPRRSVAWIHLEPRVCPHEERDAARADRDAPQRHAQPQPEVRVGGGLEGVEHVEAHARVGAVGEPVRPAQAGRGPAHLAAEDVLSGGHRLAAVEAPALGGRGGEQGQEHPEHGYSRYASSIWVTKPNWPPPPFVRKIGPKRVLNPTVSSRSKWYSTAGPNIGPRNI